MTSTLSAREASTTTADAPGTESTRRNRVLLVAAAIASVVPFYWAAVRDGLNGYYPTLDVASTILRSRAVLSAHPPLYGMWSSGSSWAGHEIHFPGAIQLYLLAVPVHVLGNSWGTLLAMATINAFWVLLAGWLIYRRIGVNGALLAFLFASLFIWSIGSENLVDARPMQMVTIPFLCFLFLVWLVTSGDIDVLPGLAIVANYLFLDHLVLALQIPVIGLCAVAGVILWIRRPRASTEGPDASLRPLRRRVIQAGAITVVMWLPSLVQQFTHSPGNLSLLVHATGRHRDAVGSYAAGYDAVVRLIAKPGFWFRGRFADGTYGTDIHQVHFSDVLIGIILVVVILGLGILAWRRRDELSLAALAVSVVGIGVSIETVVQAPQPFGFPLLYLRSLWGLSAFVWFAIIFSSYRLLAPALRQHAAAIAGVAAVVFGVLALSFADYGSAVDMPRSDSARRMIDATLPKLTGRGPIYAQSGSDFNSHRYFSALMLALDTAGVTYCVDRGAAEQYGKEHLCGKDAEVHLAVVVGKRPDVKGGKLVSRTILMPVRERRELQHARSTALAWLKSRRSIEVTDPVKRNIEDIMGTSAQRKWRELYSPADGDLTGLLNSKSFAVLVGAADSHRSGGDDTPKIFVDDDVPVHTLLTYFDLRDKANSLGSVWVYQVPTH